VSVYRSLDNNYGVMWRMDHRGKNSGSPEYCNSQRQNGSESHA